MLPTILKWMIIVIALINASYMTYDGTRAMIKGDYLRPQTGEYAGQLGPWSKLAEKIGIDPMSTTMKMIFVIYGIAGFIITICFAFNLSWSWKAMLIFNLLSLWNLFFGTMTSVLQIILLIVLKIIR